MKFTCCFVTVSLTPSTDNTALTKMRTDKSFMLRRLLVVGLNDQSCLLAQVQGKAESHTQQSIQTVRNSSGFPPTEPSECRRGMH